MCSAAINCCHQVLSNTPRLRVSQEKRKILCGSCWLWTLFCPVWWPIGRMIPDLAECFSTTNMGRVHAFCTLRQRCENTMKSNDHGMFESCLCIHVCWPEVKVLYNEAGRLFHCNPHCIPKIPRDLPTWSSQNSSTPGSSITVSMDRFIAKNNTKIFGTLFYFQRNERV